MPVTELGVDERLARSASRKLRRYGSALDDCLNSVLLTIVKMPGMRSFSVSREGDAIICSFPYPFRAFGRNYVANVTAEGDGFSAVVPELPGCLTEAYSMDELKGNLLEAVECWLGGAEDLRRAEADRRTKVA